MAEPMFDQAVIDAYVDAGWWGTHALADLVAGHAAARPDEPAYIVADESGDGILTWAQYHERSSELAAVFVQAGLDPGTRIGVILPDGATVHTVFLAAEKAGLVVAGIGARAGPAEIRHLLGRMRATALVTHAHHRGQPSSELVASLRAGDCQGTAPHRRAGRRVRPSVTDGDRRELHGGTGKSGTGATARRAGPRSRRPLHAQLDLGHDGMAQMRDAHGEPLVLLPPIGDGVGRAHARRRLLRCGARSFRFRTLDGALLARRSLGCPTIVSPRFEPEKALRAMAKHRVSVLACVSTQFIMMLNSPALEHVDLTSLRVMFTGGEAVPYERAAAFEDRTGAKVLQFYGSNETGALSGTALTDSRERRFGTAGRVIDAMQVRVFDDHGDQVTTAPLVGRPAGKGPATCIGYLDDGDANAELFTEDGWMLMGDVVEIDDAGYLRVIGRTSDIIIRGGKNISAPALEAEISEHPDVDLVAAVSMPDEILGERICVYVATRRQRRDDSQRCDDVSR